MSESKKPGATVGGSKDGEGQRENTQESQDNAANSEMDYLRSVFAQSLGLKEKPEKQLDEFNLAGIVKYMQSDRCKRVVTMAGAGISTSAGIPDFRSPNTGLYNNLAAYNLPNPQAIFEISFFKENPKPFFVLAKELYPGSFKPTVCHYFVKLLSDKGLLLRHFTQNIDTLERVAGIDGEKIVEAHGTFYTSHCLECNKEFSLEFVKDKIFADEIPKCTLEDCDGIVKPDIVFFGEKLPPRFIQCVSSDLKNCDLLIIMGTSLTVQPFASLVNRVPEKTPRLYINLEKGSQGTDPLMALMFGGGFDFDSENRYRDVFKEATCDEGCQELAELLGWGDELKELVKQEHAKLSVKEEKSSTASSKT